MADVIATNAQLARVGIDKILPIELKKLTDYGAMMGFKDVNNSQLFIRIQQESGFGLMQETAEMAPHPEVSLDTNLTRDYYWQIFKLKYVESEEKMASDQYARTAAGKIAAKLAKALNHTRNTLASSVFIGGFTGTATIDGVSLFNASHPLDTGFGTSSNTDAADLSASTLTAGIQSMTAQKANKGEPAMCMGPYTLIVPTSNYVSAEVLRQSALVPGSGFNDVNVQGNLLTQVVVNPYLTDTDSWFLVDKSNAEGLHRLVFSMGVKNRTKLDEDTNSVHIYSSFRESYDWHDWRATYGSPGA
jgi:hypothetical protein